MKYLGGVGDRDRHAVRELLTPLGDLAFIARDPRLVGTSYESRLIHSARRRP